LQWGHLLRRCKGV